MNKGNDKILVRKWGWDGCCLGEFVFFFFNIVLFGILRSLFVKSEDENAFYYNVQENITFLFCYLFEMTCLIYGH